MTEMIEIEARPKAYSYIRFSSVEQASGDSLRRQTEKAQRYAAKKGLELDRDLTFRDLGVSAFKGANRVRGGLGEFKRAVERGLVAPGSYLLLESLDRFSRENPGDAYVDFHGLMRDGITIVTLSDEREHNLEVYSGDNVMTEILVTIMQFSRAHEESRVKGQRVHAAWENKRKRAAEGGYRLTRKAPSWLAAVGDADWQVDEDKANVVRRIFSLSVDGLGKEAIARRLNTDKVPPLGKGARWYPTTVDKTLRNPAVVGTLVPHTIEHREGRRTRVAGEPIPNYYPAILDDETWDRVQGRLQAGRARGKAAASGAVRNIFAGIGRCASCGATVTRVSKGPKSKPKLICTAAKVGSGCEYRSTDYAEAEYQFLASGRILTLMTPYGGGASDAEAELERLENTEEWLRERIAHALDEIERGNSSDSLRSRLSDLEAQLQNERSKINETVQAIMERASPIVKSRLDRLADLIGQQDPDAPDRGLLNGALLEAAEAVDFDPRAGHATIRWRHGESSRLELGWPIED